MFFFWFMFTTVGSHNCWFTSCLREGGRVRQEPNAHTGAESDAVFMCVFMCVWNPGAQTHSISFYTSDSYTQRGKCFPTKSKSQGSDLRDTLKTDCAIQSTNSLCVSIPYWRVHPKLFYTQSDPSDGCQGKRIQQPKCTSVEPTPYLYWKKVNATFSCLKRERTGIFLSRFTRHHTTCQTSTFYVVSKPTAFI